MSFLTLEEVLKVYLVLDPSSKDIRGNNWKTTPFLIINACSCCFVSKLISKLMAILTPKRYSLEGVMAYLIAIST